MAASEQGPAVDLPEVVADLRAEFEGYERALMANDVAALNRYFWTDPRVLRYGPDANQYGHAAIGAYRAARDLSDLARRIEETRINTFGRDFGVANTEYVRTGSGRRGRQSQTWVRFPEGWRIVAAHVSVLPDAP
jgi:hypothetical protein